MNERFTASAGHEHAGVIAASFLTERPGQDDRADAAECQEIATYCPDRLERQYEELAHQWLILAERAERNSG
jgi:hypothetical protein